MRKLIPLLFLLLVSCGPLLAPRPQGTSAPQTLPATWTPSVTPTGIPTSTEFPTFTPVPPITLPPSPTIDPLISLSARFSDSLPSPSGLWIASRDGKRLRVINERDDQEWTLSCSQFKECSTLYPVRWNLNGDILYFAAAPLSGGAPTGMTLVTALGLINVNNGKWEAVLPEIDQYYYDFAFSHNRDYIAYALSSGEQVEEPSVNIGILRTKNNKVEQEQTLKEMYGGNILWSPYRNRIVFQVRNTETGSSVVFYDLDTGVLKYVVQNEKADLILSNWSDADNSVILETKDWRTRVRSYWYLNPFTGDLTSTRMTATPTP